MPSAAISTAIDNATYSAHRARVAEAIYRHYPALRREAQQRIQSQQPHLQHFAAIAGVSAHRYRQLAHVLRENPDRYFLATADTPIAAQIEAANTFIHRQTNDRLKITGAYCLFNSFKI